MRDCHIWWSEHVGTGSRPLEELPTADDFVSNVAEQLIEKGLATVLRHKRDDEDRSAELDKLIVAEQTCVPHGIIIATVGVDTP